MTGRPRPVLAATVLSVGTEITTGTIRDTNAGELARALTDLGVRIIELTGACHATAGRLREQGSAIAPGEHVHFDGVLHGEVRMRVAVM